MRKIISLFIVSFIVISCATQAPVHVVDGYGRIPYDQNQATYNADEMLAASSVVEETYTIQVGDTSSKIAAFFNVEEDALLTHNRLITPEQIKPGMVLKIPEKEAYVPPSTQKDHLSVNDMLDAKPIVQPGGTASNGYRLTDKYAQKLSKGQQESEKKSVQHTIGRGENIYRIGLKYGVSQFDIISANDGVNPADLKVGQVILIPLHGDVVKSTPLAQKSIVKVPESKVKKSASVQVDYEKLVRNAKPVSIPRRGMMWPAKGKLLKTYGFKERGVTHSGINIALNEFTPIRAADGGKVIYSDSGLEQYGNLILIRHNNGYVTAYAHNAYNHVKRNKWVKKGDVIALAGKSGSVERSQLHFEVRKNAKAINPLTVLKK